MDAVINGKITSGSVITKEMDGSTIEILAITEENGHELIGLLYDEMISITGYAGYYNTIDDIKHDFKNSPFIYDKINVNS